MTPTEKVTALILAGGAGSRVGGQDKGLIHWQGRPLVHQVIQRLQGQAEKLLISCNRNIDEYRSFGLPVIEDQCDGFQGPLAGIEAARKFVHSPYLAVTACDTPLIPLDLVARLTAPLLDGGGKTGPDISIAHDGEREQYLCAVIRVDCLPSLTSFLQDGHRAVKHWYASQPHVLVDFSDQSVAFHNYNDLDSLKA